MFLPSIMRRIDDFLIVKIKLSSVYAFVTNPSLSEGALHIARLPADSRLTCRSLCVPANAEFISIGDSDEDLGLEIQEPITPGPTKVSQMEFSELQHEDIDVDERNMEREQSVEVDEIVEEGATYMHKPIPPISSAPPSEADVAICPSPGFLISRIQ